MVVHTSVSSMDLSSRNLHIAPKTYVIDVYKAEKLIVYEPLPIEGCRNFSEAEDSRIFGRKVSSLCKKSSKYTWSEFFPDFSSFFATKKLPILSKNFHPPCSSRNSRVRTFSAPLGYRRHLLFQKTVSPSTFIERGLFFCANL